MTRPALLTRDDGVAVVGLGAMGLAAAVRLHDHGWNVRGVDISPAARDAAIDQGIDVAASIREAVDGAAFVLSSLPTPQVVRYAVAGADGVVAHAGPGTIVADMSTVDPATAIALAAAGAAAGVHVLDTPVTGARARLVTGTLTIMVGGHADVLAAAEPVLADMGTTVHVGHHGAGQAAKLCNNALLAASMVALAEVFTAAEAAGLDAADLHAILTSGSGASWPVHHWLADTVLAGDDEPRFRLDLLGKDVRLFCEVAEAAGRPAPYLAAAARTLADADAAGLGARDMSAVFGHVRGRFA